jgi:hypothetical protein
MIGNAPGASTTLSTGASTTLSTGDSALLPERSRRAFSSHGLEEAGDRLEKFCKIEQHKRIKHLVQTLDDLEKDLTAFALSEEMHK